MHLIHVSEMIEIAHLSQFSFPPSPHIVTWEKDQWWCNLINEYTELVFVLIFANKSFTTTTNFGAFFLLTI